jgi:hypothetical protein
VVGCLDHATRVISDSPQLPLIHGGDSVIWPVSYGVNPWDF